MTDSESNNYNIEEDMSLKKGSSKKTVSKNISKMMHEGYMQKQAVVAAMKMAGKKKVKRKVSKKY